MNKNLIILIILLGIILTISGLLLWFFAPWLLVYEPPLPMPVFRPSLWNYAGLLLAIIGVICIIVGVILYLKSPP